jgi:hypothetical protein
MSLMGNSGLGRYQPHSGVSVGLMGSWQVLSWRAIGSRFGGSSSPESGHLQRRRGPGKRWLKENRER